MNEALTASLTKDRKHFRRERSEALIF